MFCTASYDLWCLPHLLEGTEGSVCTMCTEMHRDAQRILLPVYTCFICFSGLWTLLKNNLHQLATSCNVLQRDQRSKCAERRNHGRCNGLSFPHLSSEIHCGLWKTIFKTFTFAILIHINPQFLCFLVQLSSCCGNVVTNDGKLTWQPYCCQSEIGMLDTCCDKQTVLFEVTRQDGLYCLPNFARCLFQHSQGRSGFKNPPAWILFHKPSECRGVCRAKLGRDSRNPPWNTAVGLQSCSIQRSTQVCVFRQLRNLRKLQKTHSISVFLCSGYAPL